MTNLFTLKVKNFKQETYELTHNYTRYYVRSIQGLTPPSTVINTSVSGSYDGFFYNSSRLEQRNIVITLGLRGKVEENRQLLYSIFPLKKECEIYFKNQNRNLKIKGYVESIEGDIFVQREEIQISIICLNPYFEGISAIEGSMEKVIPLFEFPFSISEPIPFGNIMKESTCNLDNIGDVECGCIFTVRFHQETSEFKITNKVTHEYMFFKKMLFVEDDIVTINTNYGNMRAVLLRMDTEINLLPYLENGSSWIKLTTGLNILTYSFKLGNHESIDVKAEFTPLFGGV